MHIERVQVDEGFLDGLDLRLVRGLNVIIGPRGSGKTSLIELIRFCLDASTITDDAGQRGHDQALSILGGGQVTVTVADGTDRISIVRSSADEHPRSTASLPMVTILGQGEIEAIGSQPSGRLHLVDRLRSDVPREGGASDQLGRQIKSITSELRDVLLEVDDLEQTIETSRDVPDLLSSALELEADALVSVQATQEDRTQLVDLQGVSATLTVRRSIFDRARAELQSLDDALSQFASRLVLTEGWPEAAGREDLLESIREKVASHLSVIGGVREGIVAARGEIAVLAESDVATGVQVDDASRALRGRLDQVEAGVGAVTREVEGLKERLGQLEAARQRLEEKRDRARSIAEKAGRAVPSP